ncbi:hypothetical protein [Mycolicibacterium sp.]|uniref:hypothetical protein n=1 Tax=Mycolicibacterium sp. TaxID=2320850 RepID=UPI0037CC91E1
MSDPAIEAVKRAVAAPCIGSDEVASVREALKPIRELHKPEVVRSPDDEQWTECAVCYGAYWPCATAKLIYTTEELES